MSKFILHSKQWLALLLILSSRIAAYVGGIRSGKTIVGAHFALQMIIERPNEVGGIFSNTNKQLTKATLKEFKGVLESYGLFENVHYVVNKNPGKKFGYRSRFTDHQSVWSFWNGAQIFTFSLETQIRGVEFGWAWGDEIQDASKDQLDVVLGRMSGSSDPKTFYTLTPPGENPEIDELIYGENHIPVVFGSTYDNQKNLPIGYIEGLKLMYDKYVFAREIMCERVTMAGFNWLYMFDGKKNVSPLAVRQPNSTVYVSFDFNVNPFVCTMSHRGFNEAAGKKYIHYFDTVVLTPEMCGGMEYIDAMVREIRSRTPNQAATNNYMITGDVSGRKEDIVSKVGEVAWKKILDGFKIAKQKIILPNVNPTHIDSRTLCNSIVANMEVLIHPKNKELIRDCEFAKAKPDGHRLKDNRKDVTQQLDLLEAMVYDMNAFNGDFIQVR